jgi:hypothetical protein
MRHVRSIRFAAPCSAFLATFSLFAAPARAQQAETFRLQGDRAAVYNLAGSVSVVAGSGDAVVVTVRRGGADATRLQTRTGRVDTGRDVIGSAPALRVMYPGDRIVYPEVRGRTSLEVRDDGTFWGDRSGGRKVEIDDSGRGLRAWADLEIAVPAGRSVLVALAAGSVALRNVDGTLVVDVGSAPITSESGRGRFVLDTGSGNVTVRGHSGDLLCDTGSGDVDAADVRGGDVTFDTGSGDVVGTRIRADRLLADTGSGDVRLQEVSAEELTADTGSGDVELDLAAAEGISVDTGSGNVTIGLPSGFSAAVEIETGSGEIRTDLPITVTEVDDDTLRGRIGDGGGRLTVDTGSGSVRLRSR